MSPNAAPCARAHFPTYSHFPVDILPAKELNYRRLMLCAQDLRAMLQALAAFRARA